MNCALLEKIETSLERAAAAGKKIYVHPKPTTWKEARENLRAFSTATSTSKSSESAPKTPENLAPFTPNVKITGCLGWTEFKGSDINGHFIRTRAPCFLDLKDDETYYAIIYEYIHGWKLEADDIIAQLGFFHITGFSLVPFKCNNWRGSGVLVDFSDIVSPFADSPWWRESEYRMDQDFSYIREYAECGELLNPRGPCLAGLRRAKQD